jgi:hypothetical protein
MKESVAFPLSKRLRIEESDLLPLSIRLRIAETGIQPPPSRWMRRDTGCITTSPVAINCRVRARPLHSNSDERAQRPSVFTGHRDPASCNRRSSRCVVSAERAPRPAAEYPAASPWLRGAPGREQTTANQERR